MPKKPVTKEQVIKTLVDAVDRQTTNIERAEYVISASFATAYLAGLTIGEMVDVTGLSPQAVRKRLGEMNVEVRRGRQPVGSTL